MTATNVLEAKDITVRFGGVVALDGVDFAVPEHTAVGLVGPNGAGKTTFFEVISGLRSPNEGQILFQGTDITGVPPRRRARLGISRTFQRLELFGELTVRQHLLLSLRRRHRQSLLREILVGDRESTHERASIDGILESLDLMRVAHLPAAVLSLGIGRLVEVARALASEPRLLLLDEPSSGLDDVETDRLVDVLGGVHRDRGLALVIVEHNLSLVLGFCDEIHVLDFGRTIARGAPQEIRDDTRVQAAYLGTKAVNAP